MEFSLVYTVFLFMYYRTKKNRYKNLFRSFQAILVNYQLTYTFVFQISGNRTISERKCFRLRDLRLNQIVSSATLRITLE